MLDHVSLNVSDAAKAKRFYTQALQPLGYTLFKERDGGFALGVNRESAVVAQQADVEKPVHLSFRAKDRDQVNAFYKAGLEAGGKDNGKPGIREKYGPDYYAAFVLDPDGNNLEAVCHGS